MVKKKFGVLVGIGFLAISLMLFIGSTARGGLMTFGDVDMDPVGTCGYIYPNASDSSWIRNSQNCRLNDTPRGSSQAGDPAECCGDSSYCSPGRLFGDVDGDDSVDGVDADLIRKFSIFLINTFPNMPTEMVPVSITTPQGPITGNEATILPGKSAILRLQVNNDSGIAVGNAEVTFTLSQDPVGVTMDGLGVGVSKNKWTLSGLVGYSSTPPYPARVEGFGQVTVTIDSTPDTPFGSTAVVTVTCTGIPEAEAPPCLGERSDPIPDLPPVSFIIHFGKDPVQETCEVEEFIWELDIPPNIKKNLADAILEAQAIDQFFCQGKYQQAINKFEIFKQKVEHSPFFKDIPKARDALIAAADEIIDIINQLPPGYQSPLCPGGCQP